MNRFEADDAPAHADMHRRQALQAMVNEVGRLPLADRRVLLKHYCRGCGRVAGGGHERDCNESPAGAASAG